jgi:hypothetical protein
MNPFKLIVAVATVAVGLGASFAASADALGTLNDPQLFERAQKDIAAASRADIDALTDAVSTCSAVSLGQRAQHFECERAINRYWARFNRGRSIDSYMAALAGLFTAFDNSGANPTDAMANAYQKTTMNLVTLTRSLNERYRQLDKS